MKMVPHKLIYLNAWFLVSGTVWERFRCGLVRREVIGGRLLSQKPPMLTSVLCLLHMDQEVSSQVVAPAVCHHVYGPPARTLTLWNQNRKPN